MLFIYLFSFHSIFHKKTLYIIHFGQFLQSMLLKTNFVVVCGEGIEVFVIMTLACVLNVERWAIGLKIALNGKMNRAQSP